MSRLRALFCELSNFSLLHQTPESFPAEEEHKNIICCVANNMSHKRYNKAAEGIVVNALAGSAELQRIWKETIIQHLLMESRHIVRQCSDGRHVMMFVCFKNLFFAMQ